LMITLWPFKNWN